MTPHFPSLRQTLALQCESYQGEKLLRCQLSLDQLAKLQDGWLSVGLQLLGRRRPPACETPEGQRVAEELAGVLSEALKRLGRQVAGETGEKLQLLLPFASPTEIGCLSPEQKSVYTFKLYFDHK